MASSIFHSFGIAVCHGFFVWEKLKKFQNIFLTWQKPCHFNNYSIVIEGKGGEKSESARTQTSNN